MSVPTPPRVGSAVPIDPRRRGQMLAAAVGLRSEKATATTRLARAKGYRPVVVSTEIAAKVGYANLEASGFRCHEARRSYWWANDKPVVIDADGNGIQHVEREGAKDDVR